MIQILNEYRVVVDLLIILIGIVIVYQKNVGKSENDNASQAKDIDTLKTDCIKCKDDVKERFREVDNRITQLEEKQRAEIDRLYDKLGETETKIVTQITVMTNQIYQHLDRTLNTITQLLKNNQK
jgi:uncharacterized protein YeaC (DUF1315 family)